ncbi:MAG: hypothetical protein K0U13_01610 [Chlamydiae bacterium]|nr:hypothetical protein [Chlamydiota bacterium]
MVSSSAMIKELEAALKKERTFQRLWDVALAWLSLAGQSQELTDLRRSIEFFRLASQKKEAHPPFLASFGEALLVLGSFTGELGYVREGLEILRQAIEKRQSGAWLHYALGHKLLYELSGKREDFESADSLFQRAIIAVPEHGALWLAWGQMLLESGFRRRQIAEVELAVEKFTSLKIDDCDPHIAAACLAEGLAMMGLFLEDLKLIHSAHEKLEKIEAPVALGMLHLIEGLYFQDVRYFAKAVRNFHAALELDAHNFRASHGLFQAFLAWGVHDRDRLRLNDALEAIERLSSLRPCSSLHLIEWGSALIRLCQMESDLLDQQAACEEAVDKLRKAIALGGDLEAEYQLGCALDLLGEITAVEEYFEESIELLAKLHARLPGDLQVTFHLAMALSHFGEVSLNVELLYEAERTFEELLRIDGEDDESLCHLGYTQLLLSEHTYDENHPEKSVEHRGRAEKSLICAAQLGSVESNYHLTCLYSLAGYMERGMAYLKRSEQLGALPPDETLWEDHWIENLRQTNEFVAFMEGRHG